MAADRGNYPLAGFETPDGQVREWYPPLVAFNGEERVFGWDTWPVQSDPAWTAVRSLKRRLKDAGPNTEVELGGRPVSLRQLLVELLEALREDLRSDSTLHPEPDEPL